MGVVNFRQVVEATGLARERQCILAPAKLHFEEAFGNIHVRRAVFAHRAELDEVRLRANFAHRPQHVETADYVVLLRERGVRLIDHRVRGGGHFREVNNRIGLEIRKEAA